MSERSYRWVQVINTQTIQGVTIQLIGTSSFEDKRLGLDQLILRHRLQIQRDFPGLADSDICSRWLIFMEAGGEMSHEVIDILQ